MPTYIIGARLTGNTTKGDRDFAQQMKTIAEVRRQHGGRLISAYVTFGRYDLLFIVEYPDQKSALAAVETNLAKGLFTLEVEEALTVEDFLKPKND
ncbi:MAG TPA: GYD domain-containing protein [Candidatus Binataceae bacterium]